MSKRMRLVFTASLLLNIVFAAVGAGMFFRYCQDIPIPGTMSPDARNFVARTYQNGREEVKPLITEVKARRQKVEDILESDKFDRKAYDAAVDDLLVTQGKIARHRADTMGKALTDLSDEDRQKFSKEIISGLTPGRPRHRGGHKGWKGEGSPKEERKSGETVSGN
jgi:uncharacterized membrane protein